VKRRDPKKISRNEDHKVYCEIILARSKSRCTLQKKRLTERHSRRNCPK
jgi:hypothetical protein